MGHEEHQQLMGPLTEPMPGSAPWSPGLGRLLLQEDEGGGSSARQSAIRIIAVNPVLRAEAERLLPALEDAKRPASREEIIAIIMREMPAWGVSTKNAGEYGVTYASYADALEGLCVYAIEEGVVRWNRGEGHKDLAMGGFPPRPPQLHKLASEGKRQLWMAAYRAKLAVQHIEDTGVEWTAERKAAERQKMIDAGYLNADGTPNIEFKPKSMAEVHLTKTPHEVAEELRRSDAQARYAGAPISRRHVEDDPGVVL